MKKVRIGTRGSALAMWQANYLQRELARRAGIESELVVLKTSGDKFAGQAIEALGVVGVFTKELEDALCRGEIDLAIHSLKDVPTEICAACQVAFVFEREDPRDALVSGNGLKLAELPRAARIGTSSLRRASQLRAARPDFEIVEMRGNVDTRLRKLDAGECNAMVLAVAGLTRLGKADRITEILGPDVVLSAVGQGALGLEFLEASRDLFRFVDTLIDRPTELSVTAERTFQARMQGGCRVPLGAWARFEGETLVMDACVLSVDGKLAIRRRRGVAGKVALAEARALGLEMAEDVIGAGGGELLKEARKTAATIQSVERAGEAKGLEGKRIVITRAPEQSDELREALEERGAEVVALPMIRFVRPKDTAELDAAIGRARTFDWILFTSQVAVRFYSERSRELGEALHLQPADQSGGTKVAVVGKASAKAARAAGFTVDFMAEAERGEGLARELGPALGGKTVLLPHSNLGGEPLARALREAGAHVASVEAYGTVAPERVNEETLGEIRRGEIDAIVFASPSAFRNFAALFEADELKEIAGRVEFAAIGPTTRKAIEERGIEVSIEPAEPSSKALAQAIAARLRGSAARARVS